MATALTAQLARIAASSTNQLDLKAQRKAHSQSLIFEQRVAASQDFDTLYHICAEGFRELCLLDARLTEFARNVFSEQSKKQERSQMTVAQNEELDLVLEKCLGLLGAKLMLKPTVKALEWLVRRFRVHEYNTTCALLTLLPYHTLPLFATFLSIVPKKLSRTFKFLHPYVESLAPPPRHTIVYAATNNPDFLAAWNNYILKCCRRGHQYHAMISYWATVMTEAITGKFDQTATGSKEAQRHKEEDAVLHILPMLNEGLSLREMINLRIGCYMILTTVVSKASLEDKVLIAMMEAVTNGHTRETTLAELVCLAVLAQRRPKIKLPKKIFKKVISLDSIEDKIVVLSKRFVVDKLVHGLILGILRGLRKNKDLHHLKLVEMAIENELLSYSHTSTIITAVLSIANEIEFQELEGTNIQSHLVDLILRLRDSAKAGGIMKRAIQESKVDLHQIEMKLQVVLEPLKRNDLHVVQDVEMAEVGDLGLGETFESMKTQIPTQTANEISFLSHSESYIYGSLARTFALASTSPAHVIEFGNLPVLRKSLANREPLFVTFFTRFWCGAYPASARAAALSYMCEHIKEDDHVTCDLQLLLPYVLYALSDESATVRQAAVDLILALAPLYADGSNPTGGSDTKHILGKDSIYGQCQLTQDISWLSAGEMGSILGKFLLPNLEECRLDCHYIINLLQDAFNGSKHTKVHDTPKELKTHLRVALFTFLASHCISTPLYVVKMNLLQTINEVTRVGNISKAKVMIPLLVYHEHQTEEELSIVCKDSGIDINLFVLQLVQIVSPADRENIKVLQRIIILEQSSPPASLREAALQRIRTTWTLMKHGTQLSLATALFPLACNTVCGDSNDDFESGVAEVLRNVPLSSDILLDFLARLPSISAEADEISPSSKRRKTSQGHVESEGPRTSEHTFIANLKQIAMVLELVEGSQDGNDPQLMQSLYRVLSDMQHAQAQLGADLSYSLSLVLTCLLSIVESARTLPVVQLERSHIRADLVVDCFKGNSDPQVQHAALLLLSSLANAVPEVVIHSVMPVFTFMGTTTLRQSDEYSAHVINQTIESVVPPLISSLHKQKGGALAGASELFLSFAAAFEHIPTHRRMAVFATLVDKIGPEDYVFALFVILVDRYGINNKTVSHFAVELSNRYQPLVQLKTAGKCLEVLSDYLKPNPTISSYLLTSNQERNRTHTGQNILVLTSWLVKNPRLSSRIAKVLKADDVETEGIRSTYSRLVQQVLQLAVDTEPSRKLSSAYDELLSSLFNLLTLPEFLRSLDVLLAHGDDAFQLRVLKTFEQRIDSTASRDQEIPKACLELIPKLTSILAESSNIALRRTTIACCDRIAEKYGKTNVDAAKTIANIVSDSKCLSAIEPEMRLMSLLCLTTLVDVMKEEMIPIIPRVLSASLRNLEAATMERSVNHDIQNAAYSLFSSLFLYIPWMVTGNSLDQFLKTAYHSAGSKLSKACHRSRTDTLGLLAKQADSQECIAALARTWDNAVSKGPEAIEEYLTVVVTTIERHSKSVIVKQSQQLVDLFLQVLDLRRTQSFLSEDARFTEEQMDTISQKSNGAIISMIYKLNDTTFRPLFGQISDWATSSVTKKEGRIFRKISWYSLLQAFFGTLKSIVTSYASFIVNDAADILSSFEPYQPSSTRLWGFLIDTLSAAFEHDQDEFWQSPNRFATVAKPLLAQFSHATSTQTTSALITCITALATSANSSDHHKAINGAILGYMRAESAIVRLAAVGCEISLTEKLGEEWLSLLPEMLPFISEAMEDDDEEVEAEVRKWVRIIEDILGESLDPMLQ